MCNAWPLNCFLSKLRHGGLAQPVPVTVSSTVTGTVRPCSDYELQWRPQKVVIASYNAPSQHMMLTSVPHRVMSLDVSETVKNFLSVAFKLTSCMQQGEWLVPHLHELRAAAMHCTAEREMAVAAFLV